MKRKMPHFGAIFKRFLHLQKSLTNPNITAFSSSVIYNHLKNQRVDEARILFDEIPSPDVYTSTKMIFSYVENFRLNEALKLFDKLPVKDTVMWNSMIKGCVKCGNMDMGLKLFDEMPDKNVISWTTVVDALLRSGKIEQAKGLFWNMPEKDVAAWNAMIHGFFVNSKVDEAIRLFEVMKGRNVITWTTMIGGLDQHGRSYEALSIFGKMVGSGLKPTSSTFSCVITACGKEGDLVLGSQVHCGVLKLGCVFDPYVTASLVTFYANCKKLEECLKVFNEKLHTNVVVWTSLLTGYGNNGKHEHALKVFIDMIRLGIVPNQSSFTSVLNSSREIEMIDAGKCIHSAAMKVGLGEDHFVGSSLVVLYTKCGNISDGILAFNEIADKNIVSWNSIIVGCAQHGCGEWALAFFTQMAKTGLDPDGITFTGLLNSCSHSGMFQKGRRFFECLSRYAAIEVKLEHYTCMVDILCRGGNLNEAAELVGQMPMEPNLAIWIALLSGCRGEMDVELAERAAEKILAIDPHHSAAYVLLSNIYAVAGRWTDVERIRRDMKQMGILKQLGQSWV